MRDAPVQPAADLRMGLSRAVAGSVALAAAVVLALYPNLRGFWGRDDFACLAVVRMIGSPMTFFTQDHSFAPHSIFRPLGFASMWLSERVFGIDYAPNAAFDIALHAAVAVLLFGLMRRLRIAFAPALVAAALFALHPAVDGSALGFSARFDVLCSLFIVASLYLQPANVEPADALPWKTALPWRHVGKMTFAYLYFPERASPGDIAGAHFLQYVDNRFEDITPDVLAGKTTPRIR